MDIDRLGRGEHAEWAKICEAFLNNWKNVKPDLERYSRLDLFGRNNVEKIIEKSR